MILSPVMLIFSPLVALIAFGAWRVTSGNDQTIWYDVRPVPVRAFLLATVHRETRDVAACNAVTGRADGQATLELRAAPNLFVTAESGDDAYRFHPLYAAFLGRRAAGLNLN